MNGNVRNLTNAKAWPLRKTQAVLFCVLFLTALAILNAEAPALAATPTPTPTLRPIPPTPTSAYIYLRPTPTALNITPIALDVPFQSDGGPMADNAINMYRFANRDHVFDFIGTGILCLVCVGYLIKLAGRTTKNE